MGVYIKNMEMPKDDKAVTIQICPDGSIWQQYRGTVPNAKAVPVPTPHGRLIDADALADVFRGFIAMYDSCPFSQLSLPDKARRDELQSALAEVINAPTIIPAEDGADIQKRFLQNWHEEAEEG